MLATLSFIAAVQSFLLGRVILGLVLVLLSLLAYYIGD